VRLETFLCRHKNSRPSRGCGSADWIRRSRRRFAS